VYSYLDYFGKKQMRLWVYGIVAEIDYWWFQMHFLLRTAVLFVICFFVHFAVSAATAAPPAVKTDGLIWTPQLLREETEELKDLPWYLNYRILSIILLVITTFVVAYFW